MLQKQTSFVKYTKKGFTLENHNSLFKLDSKFK